MAVLRRGENTGGYFVMGRYLNDHMWSSIRRVYVSYVLVDMVHGFRFGSGSVRTDANWELDLRYARLVKLSDMYDGPIFS